VFWLVMSALIVGALLWVAHFAWHAYTFEETDDAYVSGHVHQVAPRVAGAVVAVLVDENRNVNAGETLVRIDPLEYEIALHRAQANLAQSRAEESRARAAVDQALAGVVQAQAQVGQSQAQLNRATAQLETANTDFARNSRLYNNDQRAIAKSEVDNTKGSFDAAQAAVDAAKANVAGAQSNVIAAQAQTESARAMLEAAQATVAANEAAVRDAERELSYATVSAPVAGRVGNKNVEVGNRVQVGQALYALVEPDLWVSANFKETQLTRMHSGQPVELTIDAVGGKTFTGRVDSISPATGAEFALLPPDNATGNFTKVVQRVPVKIVFDAASVRGYESRIRPGLSAVVNVRVR
jgi:membrane fusion protein (multidrug efflux system)